MSNQMTSGGRYPILRTIAVLYLIIAGVVAIVGTVYSFLMLFGSPGFWADRVSNFFVGLAATFFLAITSLAIAEVIKLFMDIAHSARVVAIYRPATLETQAGPIAAEPVKVGNDGHTNRISSVLDEETAEGALMRGH